MSAFYSFLYDDCVQLLTDGAFFDEEGCLRRIATKVVTSPSFPFAITGRGSCAVKVFTVIDELFEYVDALAFYDDADALLDAVRAFFLQLQKRDGPFMAEFLIAAWSETTGPCHFVVQCHGHWDMPSFELLSPGRQIGGGPSVSMSDLAHLSLTSEDIASPSFPVRHGVAVMSAMRQKKAAIPGSSQEFYGVGGKCDLTTIDRYGATTRQLCAWPENIGKPIDPNLQPAIYIEA